MLPDSARPEGRDLSTGPPPEFHIDVRLHARERFDLHLQRCLGWPSRTKVQRLIRLGGALLNGARARAASRVGDGDRITVRMIVEGTHRDADETTPLPPPFWEDPYLLAVNKPPGRLVHPTGRTTAGTIINEVHLRYAALTRCGTRPLAPRLCHRLDRDTSGVLLISKNELGRRSLQEAFERGEVRKEYLAVVEGTPELSFRIDLPVAVHLDRTRTKGNRLATIGDDGKPSVTLVERLHAAGDYSVVLCRPLTGRQNQIRVHLAAVGHRILGDVGYGSDAAQWQRRSPIPFPGRPLLHSAQLRFQHPIWRTDTILRAAPAPDFGPFLPGQ
ncbi:MAG: RluA family pseudouridine synthase [Planctomycetota bacterium]